MKANKKNTTGKIGIEIERSKAEKLAEELKGMEVSNWEARYNSEGKKVLYLRFKKSEKPVTVKVA